MLQNLCLEIKNMASTKTRFQALFPGMSEKGFAFVSGGKNSLSWLRGCLKQIIEKLTAEKRQHAIFLWSWHNGWFG